MKKLSRNGLYKKIVSGVMATIMLSGVGVVAYAQGYDLESGHF